jgi:hypothetical protein
MPAPGSALSATVKAIGDASGEKSLGNAGFSAVACNGPRLGSPGIV